MAAQLPRALDIYYNSSLSKKNLYLTQHNSNAQLFAVENRSGGFLSPAQLTVFTPGRRPTVIGTATFHKTSSDIELSVRGHAQTVRRHGMFSRPYAMRSAATGTALEWKTTAFSSDLTLTDPKTGQVLGKFSRASFSLKKQGTLEINAMGNQRLFEEILVGGLGVVEARRRAAAAHSSAAAASNASMAASASA
jgi:hypothetical protein